MSVSQLTHKELELVREHWQERTWVVNHQCYCCIVKDRRFTHVHYWTGEPMSALWHWFV